MSRNTPRGHAVFSISTHRTPYSLKLAHTIQEMRAFSRDTRRRGARLGLVPTMGALHEGHLSLVRAARAKSDVVAVSIFVNPTQFGPNEDFMRYPRNLEQDCAGLEREGVDVVFAPSAEEMYSRETAPLLAKDARNGAPSYPTLGLCNFLHAIADRGAFQYLEALS